MNPSGTEASLATTSAEMNREKTVIWGHLPDDTKVEVQFLYGSVNKRLRRARKANNEGPGTKKRTLLDCPLVPLAYIFALAPTVVFIVLAFLPGMDTSEWVLALPALTFALLIVIGILRAVSNSRARFNSPIRRDLGVRMAHIAEDYVERLEITADPDDLRERHGTSPVRAAMDRITPGAKGAIVALLRKEDEEAVEHILRTLIEEERDRLDSQRPAEKGSNETRIADITARVLKEMRRD